MRRPRPTFAAGSLPPLLLALVLGPALLCGCTPGAPASVAIPEPDLGAAEPAVREQLEEARAVFEAGRDREGASKPEIARAYGELGSVYHAYKLAASARACYENAHALDRGELRWAYLLGISRGEAGDHAGSIGAFERALSIAPDHVPSLVRLGQLELERNAHDRAEGLFREALRQDAACPRALIGLGKIAAARGDFRAAVDHLESARESAPEATEIHYPLGLAYRGLGDGERATAFLERRGDVPAALEDPLMASVRALNRGTVSRQTRGDAYLEQGDVARAILEYRQAVAAAPDEPRLRTSLARALERSGDLDGARAELEAALRRDPDYAVAHFNLGAVLSRSGRDAEALVSYDNAIRIDRELLPAHVNRSNALRRLGRFDEAVEGYRRVLASDPRNADARVSEALSLVRLQRYGEARERLEEAHRAFPDDLRFRHALVRVLAASPVDTVRDGTRASELASPMAVDRAPFDHVVALAMVLAENGDFRGAIRLQTQALNAARRGAPSRVVRELEENLRLYERGEPCRRPWREDDPVLSPGPLNGS